MNGTDPRAMPWARLLWPFRPHAGSKNVSLRSAVSIPRPCCLLGMDTRALLGCVNRCQPGKAHGGAV